MNRQLLKVVLRWGFFVSIYIGAITVVTYQQSVIMENRANGQWQRYAFNDFPSVELRYVEATPAKDNGYLRNQWISTQPDTGTGYWQGGQWVDTSPSTDGSGYWEGGQWVSTDPAAQGGTGYWEYGRWNNEGEPVNVETTPAPKADLPLANKK